MSTFQAPLTSFILEKHPNADTLSIAKIGGWQCVVRTEDFQNDTLGVYLPLDAVAAIDHPLLSFLAGKHVKTCKLRGVVSQGVLLPFSQVKKYMSEQLGMKDESIAKVCVEGRDFSGILRVKRWTDPSIRMVTGEAEIPHTAFNKYTDIEHLNNFSSVIQEGEDVHISEKLHGTSARYAFIEDKCLIGSRGRQLKVESEQKSVWHIAYEKHLIKEKLLNLQDLVKEKQVAIYGEIVGPKVQDLTYGVTEPTLFVYDISVNGQFIDPMKCVYFTEQLKLLHVPTLKFGPFNAKEDLLLRKGNSILDKTHVREGIVIKPTTPRWNQELGRVILKVISEDYAMRGGAKDIKDE